MRRDLDVTLVAERGGHPSVIVTDPVRGSYFRLSWPESGILLHWRDAETVEQLCRMLTATYGTAPQPDDIAAVANFAFANQLTERDHGGSWQRYAAIQAASRRGWFMTALHGYLFFRVPLVHPEPWLQTLHPRLSFLFRRQFWLVLSGLAVLGVYLATRQWTALVSAVHDALRLEGLLLYAAAILGLKAVHELGHALTTVHFGCRVPSMGVAFMLGAPVLYTDTSDSWRLAERSERLKIVFAGVAAELIVATVSILLWLVLADGILRQTCFALATSAITVSLAINLNPFMRFDGYFALSDWLGVPNLQSRAFSLLTWKLRELLFGLGQPAPEPLPSTRMRLLTAYAAATAIYRLFLYLGIALLVYTMAGKALGIVLGAFEVVVFIALPIAQELKAWWAMRHAIMARKHARYMLGSVAALSASLFVPWVTTVEAPAILTSDREEAIYLSFAARLSSIGVVEGQAVEAGAVLFTADPAELERQRAKALLEHRSLEFQVRRLHASEKEREFRVVLVSKLERARERVAAVERQQEQLVIRAPFGGTVVDIDPDISAGLWLNQKRPLARLVSQQGAHVKGLIADSEMRGVAHGSQAIFVSDDASAPRTFAVVVAIAPANDGRLSEHALADRFGGSVPVSDDRGDIRTRQGWFEVSLVSSQPAPAQLMRGVVRIETSGVSPMMLAWRSVMRVLVREHGF